MSGKKVIFGIVLGAAAAIFISCAPVMDRHPSLENGTERDVSAEMNSYGAYLAGRVAHIRKDFDKAAAYYKIAYDKDNSNTELTDKLYLLLASKGHVDEAAVYAKKAVEANTKNGFAYMLLASKQMHDAQYAASIKTLRRIKDPIYESLIAPLMNAWNYAGLGQSKQAFAELEKFDKDDPVAKIHRGMLADYLGQNRKAGEIYAGLLSDKNSELSVRMLEIITNFYIRTGQKGKATTLMESTLNSPVLDALLSNLRAQVATATEKETKPILNKPQVGAAEGLFIIASTFRMEDILDVAHMYTALAVYMNPDYSTAKILMADIFSARDMYDDANALYDEIDKNDITYYAAQMKKANNLIKQEDYRGAEILLKSLSDDYDDLQIYIKLGDILRHGGRYKEAVSYYDKALELTDDPQELWPLYYAKGVALEQNGQWKEAEQSLIKAYDIKKHYLVLNYLGYTWIRQNQKVDEAFQMIVDAYNQAPYDPSINDSLGFALYNLGYYTLALPYLERAVELYPSSAIISSHLGDAYWFAHRKNEAKFQWKHALSLKDDSGELDKKATKSKIENGMIQEPQLVYDKEKIEENIKKIKKFDGKRRLLIRPME